MSTTTEVPTTPPATESRIAPGIRERMLGIPERTAEKIAADDAAKAKADEATKADDDAKRLATETAATAEAEKKKSKKPKPGPALPAEPKPEGDESAKLAAAVRAVLPQITAEGKAAAAPTLRPDEEQELEIARFAERTAGEKFAGFGDRVLTFFQQRDVMLAEKAKEFGGQHTPEFRDYIQGDEFRAWRDANSPSYQGQKGKLQEAMAIERAKQAAKKEIEPQVRELERKTLELQHAPAIQQQVRGVLQMVLTDPEGTAEKDPALAGFNADPMKFGEQYPVEAQIIAEVAESAAQLTQAALRLDHGIEELNLKENRRQQELQRILREQNDALASAHPNGLEMTDGKILVDAGTYERLKLERDPRYRTFNAVELTGMIAVRSQRDLTEKLRRRRDGVQKSIYLKMVGGASSQASAETTPAAPDVRSPEAGTAPAHGGSREARTQKSLGQRFG